MYSVFVVDEFSIGYHKATAVKRLQNFISSHLSPGEGMFSASVGGLLGKCRYLKVIDMYHQCAFSVRQCTSFPQLCVLFQKSNR